MDEGEFWRLIEAAKAESGGDCDRQAALLAERLSGLPSAAIVAFQRLFDERLDLAYTWDLWAAAYIINGGCSDDGFAYFRGWLVGQGERAYREALRDPETLLAVAQPDADCEAMLYVAMEAHERAAGVEIPSTTVARRDEPAGEPWEEDRVGAKYPRLAAKFSPFML